MISAHTAPRLAQHSWGQGWQRIVLWFHARDHAAVLDAVYSLDPTCVTVEADDRMMVIQSVSHMQATLLMVGLPQPGCMVYDEAEQQVIIFPVCAVRSIVRWAHTVVPHAPRAMIGRFNLDLADEATLGALCLTLGNPFGLLPQRKHPVLLDLA